MSEADPAIRLDHVSKSFGTRTILDDVSFDVARGTAVVILGRSGTGKSVALKHIIGLLKPDRGRVFVEGEDIAALDSRGLARVRMRMGFLFQNAALFDSITVGENVAFPLRRHSTLSDIEIRGRAQEKLAQVGLAKEYEKMPADLSGGMRKRAGLPGRSRWTRRSSWWTSRARDSIRSRPGRSTPCCSISRRAGERPSWWSRTIFRARGRWETSWR